MAKKYFRVNDPDTTRIIGHCDEESKAMISAKFPKYYFREVPKSQFEEERVDLLRKVWLNGKLV